MDSPPVVQGAITGAVAFVVGYLITLAVVMTQEADELTSDLVEGSGFLFYNAQFVDIDFPMGSINYLSSSQVSLEAPTILYRAIPIVVLIAAGFILAKQVNAQTTQDGAIAGATIAVGTVVLAIIGTFIFELSEGGVSASPPLVNSAIFVGLAFPAVLGAIGGAISTQT
jgi:hypothetical protein